MAQVSLQTSEHEEILNLIDSLRLQGISRYVDLPQIIVCGDQSSGKSSVLEAISGLRFPTKDNLCTRFATELILRRGPASKVVVTIIPSADRTEQDAERLSLFTPPSTSIADFADIVKSAEKAMGLDSDNTVFAKDILRVELCGPNQPNLTLVDLPGIFWAGNRSQSDNDAELVQSLVKSYMKSKRSIILAVVSAKNDLANQIITKLAREIDPRGQRTLGIITKPDLLHAGSDSEAAFVELARNEDVYFKLGWHVLKNRDYDTKDTTSAERDAAEKEFFQSRVWSSALPSSQLGIDNLRPRLSHVLLGQILTELPSLVRDVTRELTLCKSKLAALGAPRGSLLEQRTYLFHASQQFVDLIKSSVRGTYEDPFFGSADTDKGYNKRLRAVVQHTLTTFAARMRTQGHAQEIVDKETDGQSEKKPGPQPISRQAYLDTVEARVRRNRGRELPGLFNPSIVDELFFDQCRPWQHLLHETEERLVTAARTTIELVVEHISDSVTGDGIMRFLIRPNLETIVTKLHKKVEEVLKPHMKGHAITYNHYFTENLQKKRRDAEREALVEKFRNFFGLDPTSEDGRDRLYSCHIDTGALLAALLKDTESNMSRFACIDATNAMEAYYKVALKTIVDSFGVYAVEQCLLNELPDIFKPEIVFNLDDAMVTRIAGESPGSLAEREELNKKLKVLEDTMTTLRRMRTVGEPTDDQVSDASSNNDREEGGSANHEGEDP
ncbi:uncharacterized protein Z520_04265 [Fonsecaea multimorphosa CBS 102226]|uniref:Dynamin GTPase domain-containing protein n=1 Tax=Fonsecaea multimorphosa CBS 102226 TaxID=1442371 RepID=A0A0D2IRI3_9EURO|nr:uncharacterized protein Z520_04265 [Fonsecaea multimorphosa CBS 102226]KIX99631.1 hypothetical protein Z520_04265 [Fonsecaea multimorphosa CBS 102226]OAL26684.1 hypothetical protein AYO22_04037 [Fonsecaea multimorphosa]